MGQRGDSGGQCQERGSWSWGCPRAVGHRSAGIHLRSSCWEWDSLSMLCGRRRCSCISACISVDNLQKCKIILLSYQPLPLFLLIKHVRRDQAVKTGQAGQEGTARTWWGNLAGCSPGLCQPCGHHQGCHLLAGVTRSPDPVALPQHSFQHIFIFPFQGKKVGCSCSAETRSLPIRAAPALLPSP